MSENKQHGILDELEDVLETELNSIDKANNTKQASSEEPKEEIFSTSNDPEDQLSIDLAKKRDEKVQAFSLQISEETLQPEEISSYSQEYKQKVAPSVIEEPKVPRKNKKESRIHKHKANSFMYTTMYLLIIALSVIVISKFAIDGAYDLLAVNRQEGEAVIVITPTTTNDEVVDMLYENGAINNKLFYKLYATITDATYKPGTYTIKRNLDYEAIINSLKSNGLRIDTVKLTFIEGETAQSIAEKLEAANVCTAKEFLAALNEIDFSNYKFIKAIENDEERAYLLEGYLFPDTYEFYMYENPKSVIKRFLNNINSSKLTAEIYDKAEALGMTIDEIWTLASIIQKEAGTVEDMYLISSVFHNRLKNWTNPMLQSDVTQIYENALVELFPHIESMYDTYAREGLCAGPICNPGMDAIKAALNPKSSKYYYFVADVNGKTYYAQTLKQHEANIAYVKNVKPLSQGTN